MNSRNFSAAIVVAVALGAVTARSAPLVRLGEAEVGFRMHLGVMKLTGVDISNDDMAELSVTTNGTTITGVWKGHPLFGDGFTATATFTEKDGGWEYAFSWENLDGWKFFVETVSRGGDTRQLVARKPVLQAQVPGRLGGRQHPGQELSGDFILV